MSQTKEQLVTQAVAIKYYQAINLAMSMVQIEETDGTTIQTQWSAFEAIQSQQFASMRQQLEQCQLTNGTNSLLSSIIETNSRDANRS